MTIVEQHVSEKKLEDENKKDHHPMGGMSTVEQESLRKRRKKRKIKKITPGSPTPWAE
jgi:hypothetical protein